MIMTVIQDTRSTLPSEWETEKHQAEWPLVKGPWACLGGDNYLNAHFNIDELKGRKRIFTNYKEITSANVI